MNKIVFEKNNSKTRGIEKIHNPSIYLALPKSDFRKEIHHSDTPLVREQKQEIKDRRIRLNN